MLRRALPTLAAAGLAAAAATPAQGASTFTIRGAGFGHGIGMSQYGALGFAQHGYTYDRILRHYYRGTTLGKTSPDRLVRVLLQSNPAVSFSGATQAAGRTLQPGTTYRARQGSGGMLLQSSSGRTLARTAGPLRATGPGPLRLMGTAGNGVRDGSYRGSLEFRPGSVGTTLAINVIGLEQYVAGVISRESPSSWPYAALAAQAVTARTYAITTSKSGNGWDQYPDTRSQVYGGVAAETPNTNRAVNGTANEIVTYQGEPVVTYFFSTSGGRTENVEDSFIGAAPKPWLKSVSDPYDSVSPVHRWGPVRLSLAAAGVRLNGLVKGSFRGIKVLERGGSPRIVRAEIIGSAGRTVVTGPVLRTRFGLRDHWMTFNAMTADVKGYEDGATDEPASVPQTGTKEGGASPKARAAAARRLSGRRIAGRVIPVRPGVVVALQKKVGKQWRTAGGAKISRKGTYSVAVPAAGTYRVRVGTDIGPTVRVRSGAK